MFTRKIFDEATRCCTGQSESLEGMTQLGRFIREICYLPYVSRRGGEVESGGNREDNSQIDVDAKRGRGAVICDLLAVAIALNPLIVRKAVDTHVDVELYGTHTRGCTVCDFGHCYDGVSRLRNISWILDCDQVVYQSMFLELFKK